MKKADYILMLLLVVVSGPIFTNCGHKNDIKPFPKPLSIADRNARLEERRKWEASPDGIKYKAWEASPEGKKVHAGYEKIKRYLSAFSDIDAVVTSVDFQRANASPSGPKWLIVRIDGEEYMMQFSPKDFQRFNSLNVNDKITIRSRSAGYSPNHPYLILSGDWIARNNKILFKRDFSKNKGC